MKVKLKETFRDAKSRGRRVSLFLNFSVFLMLLGLPGNIWADDSLRRENIIKASFIFKFISFVEWPQKPNSLSFCKFGDDPFPELWDIAKSEGFVDQDVDIVQNVDLSKLRYCHVVFIRKGNVDLAESAFKQSGSLPILFIGESPRMARMGVGINFVIIENRIKFQINQKAIERRGLRISSELLGLGIPIVSP